ncbi:MAG: hypothetical protein RR382_09400 [Tannerellaceae bacterium]
MKLLSILARELKNSQKVYLYNVREHWYAYDRSALYLNATQSQYVKLERVVNNTYQIVIDRAEVNLDLIDFCPVLLCSNTEMVLERI